MAHSVFVAVASTGEALTRREALVPGHPSTCMLPQRRATLSSPTFVRAGGGQADDRPSVADIDVGRLSGGPPKKASGTVPAKKSDSKKKLATRRTVSPVARERRRRSRRSRLRGGRQPRRPSPPRRPSRRAARALRRRLRRRRRSRRSLRLPEPGPEAAKEARPRRPRRKGPRRPPTTGRGEEGPRPGEDTTTDQGGKGEGSGGQGRAEGRDRHEVGEARGGCQGPRGHANRTGEKAAAASPLVLPGSRRWHGRSRRRRMVVARRRSPLRRRSPGGRPSPGGAQAHPGPIRRRREVPRGAAQAPSRRTARLPEPGRGSAGRGRVAGPRREPGDVQFDEESGEGGTVAVDRERDLTLSAQALATIEEIDMALPPSRRRCTVRARAAGDRSPRPG